MPNNIINEVTIHAKTVQDVVPLVSGANPIDFEVLLPPPLNCWQGGSNQITDRIFPYGWYHWNRENWGTKWNAYGLGESPISQAGDDTILVFQTAWSTPRGWILALFNSLKSDITVRYLDEGREDAAVERFVWSDPKSLNGPSWSDDTIQARTIDHRRLHKLLWGVEEFTDDET